MGCHTWFSRPATEKEMELIREYAPIEIYELTINCKDCVSKYLYEKLMKSYNENVPCVFGYYYWQLGWGSGNPELECNCMRLINGELYFNVNKYHDMFRLYNYPKAVIHSRHELRKFMRKRYFDLAEWQFEKVSEFFREYPGGVITFG